MYPTGASSNIGTLLRLIQEDASKNAAANAPASDPNSPIRDVAQTPLQSPESPDSSRVISVRPEATIQAGPQVSPVAPGAPGPAAAPVTPIAPIGAPRVVAAGTYAPGPAGAPAPNIVQPNDGRSDGRGGSPAPQPLATQPFNAPLATSRFTPSPTRIGPLIVKNTKPTNRALA